jgi:hypothetical protein
MPCVACGVHFIEHSEGSILKSNSTTTSAQPSSIVWGVTFALVFVAIALKLSKAFPELANLSAFGALAIMCGGYHKGVWSWLVPMLALLISDVAGHLFQVQGIYLYDPLSMGLNYLGFAAMIGIGKLLIGRSSQLGSARIGLGLASGVLGSIAFFMISNFGSWLDPQLNYPRTLAGLAECYTLAIPFARNSLISDCVLTTFAVAVLEVYARPSGRLAHAEKSE